jgi:hypothetical protein
MFCVKVFKSIKVLICDYEVTILKLSGNGQFITIKGI